MLQLKDLWGRSVGEEVRIWDGSVDSRCSLRTRNLEGCAARGSIELAGVQLMEEGSTVSANCQ